MSKSLTELSCSNCHDKFQREIKQIDYARRNRAPVNSFCSKRCEGIFRTPEPNFSCFVCSKPVHVSPVRLKRSQTGNIFCSRTCSNVVRNTKYKGENHPLWNGGGAIYRKIALDFYGISCTNKECSLIKAGISIPVSMIDVHHRDGNRSHNEISNLEVLCVWCHALVTRKDR